MEQKDYILREIEKMGMVLRAILNKFMGNTDNPAIQIEKQFEETKEMLASDLDFDLDKFIAQNEKQSADYISSFKGINIENLETLAEVLMQMGLREKSGDRKSYLDKALHVLEYCKQKDKTYSFERERKIEEIIESLKG